jgi:hypothetical protein
MTTEEIIERYIIEGYNALKTHTAKRSPEIRKLIRHEKVIVDGNEYSCLKEFAVERVAEEIRKILPDCEIEVLLDGNGSTLTVELTEEEKRKLTGEFYSFLNKYCGV